MAVKHLWKKYSKISDGYSESKSRNYEESFYRHDDVRYTSLKPRYNKEKGQLEYSNVENNSYSIFYHSKLSSKYMNLSTTSYSEVTDGYDSGRTNINLTYHIIKIVPKPFRKDKFIEEIKADNRNEFPDNGVKAEYWYEYIGTDNKTPVISGEDTNLGEKNKPFEIEYSVKDEDITDKVTIKEYLNNRLIRTIENSNNTNQTLKITKELLNSCPLGETNTVKIYAEDEKGAGTYRNYWFKRTNTPPYFVEENEDLGTIKKAPTVTFTANDDDGGKINIRVKINQKLVKEYNEVNPGEKLSYTMDWKEFMQLGHTRQHNLWIEVEDTAGAITVLKYTFKRDVNNIEIVANTEELKKKTKLIVFNANLKLADDAKFEQFACNDFGTGNTWERIQNGVPYEFKNKHAGNDKIGYKCKLIKGSTESEIKSIGGSFI